MNGKQMKNRTRRKDALRLIKSSKGRFMSLSAIVAIGVAFFVGLTSSSTMMASNVDTYNDENNLKDITVYSSYGFDDSDEKAIKELKNVKDAEGTKFADVYAAGSGSSVVARIHSYSADDTINQFTLVDGRLPKNENEAVADANAVESLGFKIGTKIELSRPDNDLDTYLSVTEVTIVGTIKTPLYLNKTKETSTLNDQSLSTYFYVPESAFSLEYDNEMNVVTVKGKELNSFYDEYEDYCSKTAEEIEDLSETQASHMKSVIADSAESTYEEGKANYDKSAAEFSQSISDAQAKLDDAANQIAEGKTQIQAAKDKLNASQSELDASKESSKEQLENGLNTIAQNRTALTEKQTALNAQVSDLKAAQTDLNNQIDDISSQNNVKTALNQRKKYNELLSTLNNYSASDRKKFTLEQIFSDSSTRDTIKNTYGLKDSSTLESLYNAVEAKLEVVNKLDDVVKYDKLNSDLSVVENNLSSLYASLNTIYSALDSLDQQEADANAGLITLDQKTDAAQSEIDSGWAQVRTQESTLKQAEASYTKGAADLAASKTDGQTKLDAAKAKLDKAEQNITDLADNKWTVLTREDHYASRTYKNSVEQMSAIAGLFPVFFFMVAALVCLTTMTRMIDEERGQIGIQRALGYTRTQCAAKYLFYAASATLIGSIAGSIVGILLFPIVVYQAWNLVFVLPQFHLYSAWTQILTASAAFMAVMLATTVITAWSDMREVPSQLLRPKSPKLGKSNFIEHIGFIWKHVSFTWKVTIRNLLRYKRRLIMTVIGVAGCTGLMIVGFGIRGSIDDMINLQFGEIMHYDGKVTMVSGTSDSELDSFADTLSSRSDVDKVTEIGSYNSTVKANDEESTVYTEVYDSEKSLENVFTLRTREGHTALTVSDDGVIISEKLSENLGLKTGDTFTLESSEGVRRKVKVAGICEMYIQHYVFMSESYYEKVYGVSLAQNTLMIKVNENDYPGTKLQSDLANDDQVDTISFNNTVKDMQKSIEQSMDLIIAVIIIASMSLAFVVLGNLTNINISERTREIATLKVLGFYPAEVQNYIYKENHVLVLIGALLGMPVGIFLHHWIMNEVEMDYIMYGRDVSWSSHLISILLTIGFGYLVDFFMKKKLRSIDMVESLKSVE